MRPSIKLGSIHSPGPHRSGLSRFHTQEANMTKGTETGIITGEDVGI